jgi:hypothetical protein
MASSAPQLIPADRTRQDETAAIVPCEVSGLLRGSSFRNVIEDLAERVRGATVPHFHRQLARMQRAVDGLGHRFDNGRLARVAASLAAVRAVEHGIVDRLGLLRWRLRNTRLGRSADGIIVIPVLLVALVLGILAATAATGGSAANSDDVSPARNTFNVETAAEAITETIVRDGETVRVVRERTMPGRVAFETVSGDAVTIPGGSVTIRGDSVTLPGHTSTVRETDTETVTVTTQETITETVTIIETVTETETVTLPSPPPEG